MVVKSLVREELQKIHRDRNRISYIPTTLIYFFSLYVQSPTLALTNFMIACLATSMIGLILRLMTYEFFFDSWKAGKLWARVMNITGFILLSMAWVVHFLDIYFHYGPRSENVSYIIMLLVGHVTAATVSLAASRESYYSYVLPMTVIVALTKLSPMDTHAILSFTIVAFYLLFSISGFRVTHDQLKELIGSRIRETMEKDRLQSIMDTVPGFVGLIDKTGLVYTANHATRTLYPDIVGRKLGDIDPTSDWEQFIIEFLHSGRTSAVTEQMTAITGTVIHTLLNVKKMDDGGVIVVSIITTDLVEARAKLREQEAHTQYTAKLASLGEMAAGIAHEVNNPLTIILGSANIMKKIVTTEPIDKDMVSNLADKMVETTGRISKTVKSLKALSRNAENDPMSTVSVGKVLDLSLDLCQQNFKNHAIIFKKSEGLQEMLVTGREVQLSQVIVNLLNNAGDAVKNETDRWVEFKADINNGFVDIYVSDSGKGIPVDIRHRIMEPFFTTKDVNQGTGLGLSISKKIVEEHGGELKLLLNAEFTTFLVRLRMAQQS